MIMRSLMICRRQISLSLLHPLQTTGGANLRPARLARSAKRCPSRQRQLH
jgi:hypothetical protein